ncbi:zinc finger protein [Apiospora arundinis]|uniref:Zinc finger protein n=1 Tax=Apiospora arundinis TaxID=335852 RepID=A0ABR2JMA8_9PEZI
MPIDSAFDRALDEFKATTKESMLKEFEKIQQRANETFAPGAFAKAFHELLDVYEKLGESIPMVLQFEKLFQEDDNMRRVLFIIWKDILEFHRQALKYFQQPMWKQLFQATWDTYKSRFTPLIDNIRGHGHLIQAQAAVSQIEEFRRNQDLWNAQLNETKESQEAQRLIHLKTWLDPPNVENDQHELCKIWKNCPGSGQWLLDNRSLKEWIDPHYPTIPPLLWINGIPGAGKTVLSSLIVDALQNSYPSSDILYFYCKHENYERNNYVSIGRCFLSQLLLKHKDMLVPYLYERFSSNPDPILSSIATIESLLNVALKNCTYAYIIIDGIDECGRDERRKITRWFRDLIEDLQPPRQDQVRCLFVSQDDGIARKDFRGLEMIKIERQNSRADIHTFSLVSAEKIQVETNIPDELKTKIVSKVEEAADVHIEVGMFLLAKLIVENLMQQACVEDVELELEEKTLPRELKQAYARITSRIFDNAPLSAQESSLFILRWLVSAKRPIKWHEIQAAKAINVDAQSVELKRRGFRKDTRDLCGPLVEIREDGTVELVHSTAKSFLVEEKHVDMASVEVSNTVLCLDYLNMPGFRTANIAASSIPSGYYAFMDCAAPYWLRHLENGLTQSDYDYDLLQELREPVEAFLTIHFTPPTKHFYISQNNVKKLQLFRDFDFYDKLETAVVSTRKELTFLGEMKPAEVALDLASVVRTVRVHLETAYVNATGQDARDALERVYGINIFRCPRLSCRYFYTGFQTSQQRNAHVEKHTRPFRCDVLACPSSTLGMSTMNELNKHKKEVHSIAPDDEEDDDFPDETELVPPERSKPSETIPRPRDPKTTKTPQFKRARITEYRCPECQKVFGKKFNLDSHMITHSGRRDFLCNVCAMGFARDNDRNRHQATHREKEFECGGTLNNGQSWGCHKKFARADTLKSHHNSAAGQACIQPFLQQQQESLYGANV